MKKKYLLVLFALPLFVSCSKKEGPEGKKSLIDMVSESAGANCPYGGYKVNSGIDLNRNNTLDATEIESTKFICNGATGNNSLVSIVPEAAGANCAVGGYKVITGVDINNSHVLDAEEIQNTQYVCTDAVINEIRLPLDFWGTTTELTGTYGLAIHNFNKNNYPGLDSIVYAAGVYSSSSSNTASVDLVNMADASTIAGSLLTSNLPQKTAPIQVSANLYNALPNGPIDIGLRLKSQTGATSGTYRQPYLVLYHKK